MFLRKQLVLTDKPARVAAVTSCDNEFVLTINGRKVASGADWTRPASLDLTPYFTAGVNTIAVEAINWPDAVTGKGLGHRKESSAGFIFFAAGFYDGQSTAATPGMAVSRDHAHYVSPAWTIGSDETWLCSQEHVDGWASPDFDTTGWKHASKLTGTTAGPWKLGDALTAAIRRQVPPNEIRSVLFNEDPLSRAMGRPNREQVVTRRDSIATTLQALELTNGSTLDEILKVGASNWLRSGLSAPDLSRRIFEVALGRLPSPAEIDAALQIVGATPSQEGVEDLLWAVVMLPEFQMIY
jgi:hypothetical protein